MDQLVVIPLRTYHMHRAIASAITGFNGFEHAICFNEDKLSYNFRLPSWIVPSSELPVRYGNINCNERLWESYLGLKWTYTPTNKP